jgi:hypothetical protein
MSGGETSVSGTDDNAVTLSYTVGLEQVFINGVLQVRGTDYVATTGTSVTGLSVLVASDIVTVVCYAPFNIANTIAPTVIDAKGDLLVGTADNTIGKLTAGANNAFLRTASGESTGLKWDIDAWDTWTPTTVGWTIGNGTFTARYKKIGKTVFFRVYFKAGSTTSFSGSSFTFTLPSAPNVSTDYSQMTFNGVIHDAGTAIYACQGIIGWDNVDMSIVNVQVLNAAGTYLTFNNTPCNSTTPITWTTNDKWSISGTYEEV